MPDPTPERRGISRKAMEQLMLGAGRARRFTQDTPVLPDVWLRYAGVDTADEEKGASRFDDAQKLLLTPHLDAPAGQIRQELVARLDAQKEAKSRSRVIYNQSTVAATLTYHDLLRVVLPMTEWWWRKIAPQVVNEESFNREEVRAYIARAIEDPEQTLPPPPELRKLKLTSDVLWLVRVVGALSLLHSGKPLPEVLTHDRPDLRKRPASAPRRDAIWRQLTDAALDAIDGLESMKRPKATIHSVCLNRTAGPTVSGSTLAVKADAARRLFEISCARLTWAVLDSGIDATHPAFRKRDADQKPARKWFDKKSGTNNTRIVATYDFTCIGAILDPDSDDEELPRRVREARKDPAVQEELDHLRTSLRLGLSIDWKLLSRFLEIPIADYRKSDIPENDHGTHVAGILAGDWRRGDDGRENDDNLQGVCPDLNLYDLRVLGGPDGTGDEFNVMAALQFVRHLNATNDVMAVHGVNLSMSIPHDVTNFACGRTPVCDETERVVNSGIVVVAAAGNQGYRKFSTPDGAVETYSSSSITDPGNADLVITVGATHRTRPHTYGVSYFSSRGPTGDGRCKPDLVAPGEKIASAIPNKGEIAKDGTSQAAPHVSGAAALLMARHNELVARPARVKEILCSTATDLGRERYFQGAGMLDILRALQSV